MGDSRVGGHRPPPEDLEGFHQKPTWGMRWAHDRACRRPGEGRTGARVPAGVGGANPGALPLEIGVPGFGVGRGRPVVVGQPRAGITRSAIRRSWPCTSGTPSMSLPENALTSPESVIAAMTWLTPAGTMSR